MHIPFEKHFKKKSRSYDSTVGDWWLRKSNDRAHQIAYRNIVHQIHKNLPNAPRRIVDYACGNGLLFPLLKKEFPSAEMIGLDGSKKMLERAAKLDGSIRFIRTSLPNFTLKIPKADAVVFIFPNMNFSVPRTLIYTSREKQTAELLATLPGSYGLHHARDLLRKRSISRHIRTLLKRGGFWFKAEYSGVAREKLTDTAQWRLSFTESAFNRSINGQVFRDRFEFIGSQFVRSRVVNDVYDQSLDPADRRGGYFLSIFRAL